MGSVRSFLSNYFGRKKKKEEKKRIVPIVHTLYDKNNIITYLFLYNKSKRGVYFVVCGWWDFIGRGWLSVKEVWCAQDRSVSRRVNCEFKTSASKKSLYLFYLFT